MNSSVAVLMANAAIRSGGPNRKLIKKVESYIVAAVRETDCWVKMH